MIEKIQGIGLIAQAIADICGPKPDFTSAYKHFMEGLGLLGVHQAIVKVMAEEQKVNPKQ